MQTHNNSGFTLIEVLIYLALFGLMFAGVVLTGYSIFESTARTQSRDLLTSEGNFLLDKIGWSMNGATAISTVASPPSVTITRSGSPTPIVLDSVASCGSSVTDLELKRAAAPALPLNNCNVQVTNLAFVHAGSGTNPESLTASFTLSMKTSNGSTITQDFSTTKYLRK